MWLLPFREGEDRASGRFPRPELLGHRGHFGFPASFGTEGDLEWRGVGLGRALRPPVSREYR